MMLTERPRMLEQEVDALKQRREVASRTQAYTQRATMLEGPAGQLASIAAVRAVFAERGIAVDLERGLLRSLHDRADELRAAYSADRATILEPDETLRFAFWAPIRTLPKQVGDSLAAAWAGYVAD